MAAMSDDRETLRFGEIAIKLGFTSLEHIEECMRLQEKMVQLGSPMKKLGDILLAKGYITEVQLREILKMQENRIGAISIPGYRILSKIGQGSMGSIYKALQVSMDRVVAIKILSPKYGQNRVFRERFVSEARAVARLNHPNIIQGIDVGEANGFHYFAMEYIDGPTVGELLKRGGALDEKRALHIVIQISRALHHAFQHGILHRDIKPDNVLLTRDGVAKLCDLGLAKIQKREDPSGTRPGAAMGTPYYISPEQARGEENVDTRSDIYSLCATLHHMVVGQVPFQGESASAVIAKHLTEPLVSPRERNPLVSPQVEFILLKGMQKAREDRYQFPHEILRDLEAVTQGGEPQGFRPAGEKRGIASPKLRRSSMLRRARRFRGR